MDPFVRVSERITAATSLTQDDRDWLRGRLKELTEQWEQRPDGRPDYVVHGDAWVGNVARTANGPVLMDFERVTIGPPEWDLVSTALKTTTTGAVTEEEYAEFCAEYGMDVTQWEGYELLAGARVAHDDVRGPARSDPTTVASRGAVPSRLPPRPDGAQAVALDRNSVARIEPSLDLTHSDHARIAAHGQTTKFF
ncbi:phosphotransferase family protein [Streptomyces sp. NPDC091209]|uniref:phosphotransferase family protein n=1 Tax=Streptomyces sp. NPDC091209 TaxID=3365974 RepID=UPI00380B8C66